MHRVYTQSIPVLIDSLAPHRALAWGVLREFKVDVVGGNLGGDPWRAGLRWWLDVAGLRNMTVSEFVGRAIESKTEIVHGDT